jgi:hypothetical protein
MPYLHRPNKGGRTDWGMACRTGAQGRARRGPMFCMASAGQRFPRSIHGDDPGDRRRLGSRRDYRAT